MKLVSYKDNSDIRVGIFNNDNIYDLQNSAKTIGLDLPSTMLELLNGEEAAMTLAHKVNNAILSGEIKESIEINQALLAPIPNPPSCRDAYAFRQHVATARRNRGVDMIPEFDMYPIFYSPITTPSMARVMSWLKMITSLN